MEEWKEEEENEKKSCRRIEDGNQPWKLVTRRAN
jgi:hypothetical protein